MVNKQDRKFIGIIVNITENVKPEFLAKIKRKHPTFINIEIYNNKQYGAVAKIYERNSCFDRFHETITDAQRKKMQKKINSIKPNEKLDTSDWVKPDEESIRNELVRSLFYLTIFKEDNSQWNEEYGKARAFYSILHSHSPKNPQGLSNFCIGADIGSYFETVIKEYKNTPACKAYNKHIDYLIKEKDIDKVRVDYKNFKEKYLKEMIKIELNPPKFKDYLGKIKTKDVSKDVNVK